MVIWIEEVVILITGKVNEYTEEYHILIDEFCKKYDAHIFVKTKTNDMAFRYDYRNDYKNWDKSRIKEYLPKLKDKLLQNIGICQSNADDYLKRIIYLENKL